LCYTKANNCIFKIYDDVFIDHWQWTMNSSGRPHSLTSAAAAALDVRALLVMRTSHSIEKKNKNFVVFQQQLANDGHNSPPPLSSSSTNCCVVVLCGSQFAFMFLSVAAAATAAATAPVAINWIEINKNSAPSPIPSLGRVHYKTHNC